MNASVHRNTPSLAVSGPRGEAIRTVEYLRKVAGGAVQALVTRQQHDVAGRPVAQFDPRLTIPNTQTVFSLNGQPLKTANVDAGVNVTLPGLTGESRKTWDANGNHRHITYDNQMRPIAVAENGAPDIETFTYARHLADPGHNLRGQLTGLTDASGSVEFKSYALTGQPLSETRTFTDAQTYTSQQVFSPLGAMLESTDAGGHQQQWIYDVAGQLIQAHLQINGEAWQPILKGMRYNAEGKVIEQQSANDVTSSWVYDKANGRLRRHSARKASGTVLKDDEYEDDPMGNIIGIYDLTYRSTYFRNQRVDGVRKFEYDSLSRLTRATGHDDAPPKDNPGRPQPTDPNDRCNFVQTYEMDENGNLTCLTHVRDGNTYHYEMFVDPDSNRAVRWKKTDPTPDFKVEFNPAGNLKVLQRGQPIQWNNRNQVQSVTLVEHASGPPDTERYQYSQGVRVHKRLETHSRAVSHFVDVRYLQNLQIRSKDDGELLHLITVPTGVGQVTCLHWINKRPVEIENNQLRYTLPDHLGSSGMELDDSAQMISKETYYPYGGTATLAARSQIEVDYKFIRYSGQETDNSGLIDYRARCYASWLCRWISADPAGDVDGPNRYAFVGNNPMTYFDNGGLSRTPAELKTVTDQYERLLATIEPRLDTSIYQFNNLNRTRDIYASAGKRAVLTLLNVMASAVTAGLAGSAATFVSAPVVHGAAPVVGVATAALAADITGNAIDSLGQRNAFGRPLLPTGNEFDLSEITEASKPFSIMNEVRGLLKKYDPTTVEGNKETLIVAEIGYADNKIDGGTHLEKFLAFFRWSVEITEALNGTLGPQTLDQVVNGVTLLSDFLNDEKDKNDSALEELESLGGENIALATGTRHRITTFETVIKAKMQRVVDLRERVAPPRARTHSRPVNWWINGGR